MHPATLRRVPITSRSEFAFGFVAERGGPSALLLLLQPDINGPRGAFRDTAKPILLDRDQCRRWHGGVSARYTRSLRVIRQSPPARHGHLLCGCPARLAPRISLLISTMRLLSLSHSLAHFVCMFTSDCAHVTIHEAAKIIFIYHRYEEAVQVECDKYVARCGSRDFGRKQFTPSLH